MNVFAAYRRPLACLLLSILFAAQVGHKVHIYLEDRAHFAAFCGDLLPDNGAHEGVVERCGVDDYDFYPFLGVSAAATCFYRSAVAVLPVVATRCKAAVPSRGLSLRAPPAA